MQVWRRVGRSQCSVSSSSWHWACDIGCCCWCMLRHPLSDKTKALSTLCFQHVSWLDSNVVGWMLQSTSMFALLTLTVALRTTLKIKNKKWSILETTIWRSHCRQECKITWLNSLKKDENGNRPEDALASLLEGQCDRVNCSAKWFNKSSQEEEQCSGHNLCQDTTAEQRFHKLLLGLSNRIKTFINDLSLVFERKKKRFVSWRLLLGSSDCFTDVLRCPKTSIGKALWILSSLPMKGCHKGKPDQPKMLLRSLKLRMMQTELLTHFLILNAKRKRSRQLILILIWVKVMTWIQEVRNWFQDGWKQAWWQQWLKNWVLQMQHLKGSQTSC